jgi:hypothetical protein
MSNDHKKDPGSHYSGTNPIPNIQRFIANLDAHKKEQNEKINREMKEREGRGEAVPYVERPDEAAGASKRVTDPTTGNQVQIEDVNEDFIKRVENPVVMARFRHDFISSIHLGTAVGTKYKSR